MVGQQDIGVQTIAKKVPVTMQKLKIAFSVLIFPEKGLAIIASDNKMVYRPVKLGSKCSRHLC
jgi:hypothetical protein